MGSPADVIVIGAGMAGLTCAQALRQRGVDNVVVVEARDRVGGRIHTDREFADGINIELGAQWVHGTYLGAEYKSPGNSLLQGGPPDVLDLGHGGGNAAAQLADALGFALMPRTEWMNILPFDAATGEPVAAEVFGVAYERAQEVMEEIQALTRARDTDWSLADALSAQGETDPLVRESIETDWTLIEACDLGDLSEKRREWEEQSIEGADQQVSAGYDSLPKSLAHGLDIRFDWPVARVEYTTTVLDGDPATDSIAGTAALCNGVQSTLSNGTAQGDCKSGTVTVMSRDTAVTLTSTSRDGTAQGGRMAGTASVLSRDTVRTVTVTSRDGSQIHARCAVVTVPLRVLKRSAITFVPQLPLDKQHAIAAIGVGAFTKIFLRFAEPFWDTTRTGLVFSGATSNPCVPRLFLTVRSAAGTGTNSLMGMIGGRAAATLDGLDSSGRRDVIQQILAMFRRAFGDAVSEPIAVKITGWSADPYAYGAYSYLALGATSLDIEAMKAPVDGCVFFAGEASSKFRGYVHGAMESGLRAAREVYEVLRKPQRS